MKAIHIIILGLVFMSCSASGSPLLSEWQERSFVGNTQYRLEQYQGRTVIRGDTMGAASMLYKEQRINVLQRPVISWRWRVAATYGVFDEQTKAGDDYPARFYVVIKTGPLPWQTLAINYVWSSNATVGDTWANAFTQNAMMVAVRAGDELAGQWIEEKRNVVDDFKRFFNVDISHLDGYAIMVDGDNTGSKGTAWFSDIAFIND